jgi:hypothetical protein
MPGFLQRSIRVHGFVAAADSDYDGIRKIMEKMETMGTTKEWQLPECPVRGDGYAKHDKEVLSGREGKSTEGPHGLQHGD